LKGFEVEMDKDKIITLWEQHLGVELFAKDVDATMATMTSDPYVNHVPTMTGGVGSSELRRFYAHQFITRQPDDFEVVPISWTVGEETLVYWDQASVLVQVGLLAVESLPIAGVEVAQKALDPKQPSNALMFREWAESEA
jgi:carboxymethylenebutenolidase